MVLQVESSPNQKSSVFLVSIIFHIQTRKCTKLFTENITEYAKTVCTRPLLRGEAKFMHGVTYQQHASMINMPQCTFLLNF